MKHVKTLTLAFTLMFVLATAVSAGETSTPPEPPPCAPGETHSPPCAGQSVNDDPVIPGETAAPPAQPAVDITDITEAVMWALLLF